jgi:hypothetical protein
MHKAYESKLTDGASGHERKQKLEKELKSLLRAKSKELL